MKVDLRETKGLSGLGPSSFVFFGNVLGVLNPTASDTDRRFTDRLLASRHDINRSYRTKWGTAYLERKDVGAMPDREQNSCRRETTMVIGVVEIEHARYEHW